MKYVRFILLFGLLLLTPVTAQEENAGEMVMTPSPGTTRDAFVATLTALVETWDGYTYWGFDDEIMAEGAEVDIQLASRLFMAEFADLYKCNTEGPALDSMTFLPSGKHGEMSIRIIIDCELPVTTADYVSYWERRVDESGNESGIERFKRYPSGDQGATMDFNGDHLTILVLIT